MKIVRLVLLCALVVGTVACNPVGNQANSHSTILVDLDAVAQALGRDETMKQEIQTTEQKLRDQLVAIAGELQKKINLEKNKLNDDSSEEDKNLVRQFIAQAQQSLKQQQLVAEQKGNQVKTELISKFRDEVKKAAIPIALQKDAMYIKVISADVLWFDPDLDITDEVIGVMRTNIE